MATETINIENKVNIQIENESQIKEYQVYRYKFDETIMSMITQFAKLHQFDDRKTYKEEWQKWFETNKSELNNEIERLVELGYKGDIVDKMFKAGRYYFRKKKIENENKEEKKRRNYISVGHQLLQAMDNHIVDGLNSNNKFKPAKGYDDFCKTNVAILEEEIRKLGCFNQDEISLKIKKTYKNRYYNLTHKNNNKKVVINEEECDEE